MLLGSLLPLLNFELLLLLFAYCCLLTAFALLLAVSVAVALHLIS